MARDWVVLMKYAGGRPGNFLSGDKLITSCGVTLTSGSHLEARILESLLWLVCTVQVSQTPVLHTGNNWTGNLDKRDYSKKERGPRVAAYSVMYCILPIFFYLNKGLKPRIFELLSSLSSLQPSDMILWNIWDVACTVICSYYFVNHGYVILRCVFQFVRASQTHRT